MSTSLKYFHLVKWPKEKETEKSLTHYRSSSSSWWKWASVVNGLNNFSFAGTENLPLLTKKGLLMWNGSSPDQQLSLMWLCTELQLAHFGKAVCSISQKFGAQKTWTRALHSLQGRLCTFISFSLLSVDVYCCFLALDWFTGLCLLFINLFINGVSRQKVIWLGKSVQQSMMWPEAKNRFESKRKTTKKQNGYCYPELMCSSWFMHVSESESMNFSQSAKRNYFMDVLVDCKQGGGIK